MHPTRSNEDLVDIVAELIIKIEGLTERIIALERKGNSNE